MDLESEIRESKGVLNPGFKETGEKDGARQRGSRKSKRGIFTTTKCMFSWVFRVLMVYRGNTRLSKTRARWRTAIYRAKNVRWRRKIAYEVDMVDKLRLQDKDISSQKKAKPPPRFRDRNGSESKRVAPKGLPKSMYCSTWLRELTPQAGFRGRLRLADFP